MRNNQDRLGAKPAPDTPNQPVSAPVPEQEPAPLSFSTPTEFVDLPSKGLLYPEDHPLHKQETVEIRYMTAKDEDILASRNLLKKGIAIDRLLQNVIVDKRIKIEDLLVGDKNAIVIATRITGYGSDYKTNVSCPACGASVKHEFDLEEARSIEGYRDFIDEDDNVSMTENGTFLITLPKLNVEVEVKLLTGADENRYLTMSKQKKKHSLIDSTMTDQLRLFIVSVNGDTNRRTIGQLIDNMPASDSRYLRLAYGELMPNVDLTQDFACEECGHVQEMEVPLTANFFWPGR
jgi:hypothetical protein